MASAPFFIQSSKSKFRFVYCLSSILAYTCIAFLNLGEAGLPGNPGSQGPKGAKGVKGATGKLLYVNM